MRLLACSRPSQLCYKTFNMEGKAKRAKVDNNQGGTVTIRKFRLVFIYYSSLRSALNTVWLSFALITDHATTFYLHKYGKWGSFNCLWQREEKIFVHNHCNTWIAFKKNLYLFLSRVRVLARAKSIPSQKDIAKIIY